MKTDKDEFLSHLLGYKDFHDGDHTFSMHRHTLLNSDNKYDTSVIEDCLVECSINGTYEQEGYDFDTQDLPYIVSEIVEFMTRLDNQQVLLEG